MRMWFDVSSPPHVHLTKKIIDEFGEGNEVLITTRDFYDLTSLLESSGLDYVSVGKHADSKTGKFFSGLERTKELIKTISRWKPDVGLGKHSTEGPIVSRLLGLDFLLMMDHEPAPQNLFMLPFSREVLVSGGVDRRRLRKFLPGEIRGFESVYEYAYCRDHEPDPGVLDELGLKEKDEIVVARTEPHLSGHSEVGSLLPELLKTLVKRGSEVVLIPRNRKEEDYFSSRLGITVPHEPVNLLDLYGFSDLVVSAGSTMNREACISGCPALSICRDELPGPDHFLLEREMMFHETEPERARERMEDILDDSSRYRDDLEKKVSGLEDPLLKIGDWIGEKTKKPS